MLLLVCVKRSTVASGNMYIYVYTVHIYNMFSDTFIGCVTLDYMSDNCVLFDFFIQKKSSVF